MKRITALLLTALMILTALPVLSFAGRFEDVSDGKWYSEGISFCAANEYMAGTSEAIFDRSGSLTRAMFVTILAKLDDADVAEYWGESSFTDVKPGKWYSTSIEWAYQNGLAAGVGEGIFGYKLAVTRAQIATFLYVYAEYFNEKNKADADKQIDVTLRADLTVFKDVDRVPSWAKNAMEWAVASQLFGGVGEGYLDPRGNCTRAQAAVLIRAFVLNFLSDCEHEWSSATCTEMSVCSKCALKNATELGHDFADRPCNESVKCSRCDEVSPAKEHNFTAATCTEPSVCLNCGTEKAPAKGHVLLPANYALPARCQVCGYTSGTAIAHTHNYVGMTCEGRGVCLLCRKFCAPLGHTTSNGYCSRCDLPIFATAHNQVVYHINKYGTQDGQYKYLDWMYVKLALIPGKSDVYVIYETTNGASDLTYRFEMLLPDSTSDQYDFVAYCYDEGGCYFTVSGRVKTDFHSAGGYVVTGYQGDASIRDAAVGLTSYYLSEMLREWSSSMYSCCGVSSSGYGFES